MHQTLSNKRVQSDAAAAAGNRAQNWLCKAARIETDLGKLAARLTRRALDSSRQTLNICAGKHCGVLA
jgi:hypothetical protein